MENEIQVEKRKKISHPYKDYYRRWKQIAYGLLGLSLLLSFLLINALRGIH
jgi:hypothetical protein